MMTRQRYRAWRFAMPFVDDQGAGAGLRIDTRGKIAMVEGASSVRQSILLLLSTRPGERVMRPTYGCYLHRLVFSPNDQTTAGLAIHYVRQAVQRWEPRVDILRVDAAPSPLPDRPAQLDIYLEYQVRSTLQSEAVTVPLHLGGEAG